MDPRLLHYYNLELQHLREMGAEFAEEFPKVAARLGINGLEVTDPYVERLLEGASFLAARVQLKLDAEFPRFTQALLEGVHPHYLSPTPSMLVAQCVPDPNEPNLAGGFTIPRGSAMHGAKLGDQLPCEFRTAHDVQLWPIEVVSASYFTHAPDLPLAGLPVAQRIKGGLRIRLKTTAELTFAQTAVEHLTFHLTGRPDVANWLYELCLATSHAQDAQGCLGVLIVSGEGTTQTRELLPASAVTPVGFSDAEALLPVSLRSFQGYRLLQEYFSFPQRFRFMDVAGLRPALKQINANELELVILLARGIPSLESLVEASNVALFCTPAVNLFEKRGDRIHVSEGSYEYHVVPDRAHPMDFEVYEVRAVQGFGTGAGSEQEFRPFYAAYTGDHDDARSAYFTTRREPRLMSAAQKRKGARTSYIGSEVFLSLVDAKSAPFSGELRQLSVQTLCTNRDLALQMPVGVAKSDLTLDVSAPVTRIKVVGGPSRPYGVLADGAVAWKAIGHLSLNYLALVDSSPQEGAAALRDVLELYVPAGDSSVRKQIEAIRTVAVTPAVARLPAPRPSATKRPGSGSTLAFGRGIDVAVEVDELAFEGGSAFMLGAVLQHYLARAVSINSFTRTTLKSLGRGVINQWVPQWGVRPTL
jgi:type VI secretion system protein ImpG